MAITLQEARKKLDKWLEAEDALATAQSYTIGSRVLTRANLNEVAKRIEYWEDKVKVLELQARGKRIRRTKHFVPRDF